MEARKGRQTPTISVVMPYKTTKGQEAVELYNQSTKKALPWQELLLNDIMGIDENGQWVHQKFGLEIPRRNGKNEVIVQREFWGLVHGEKICHTAHRVKTSSQAWERLYHVLADAGYVELGRRKKDEEIPEKAYKKTAQVGMEKIEVIGGGSISFRTRTEAGGLGEGFDLLVIDEAQEYTSGQSNTLKYTVSASKNPQTILIGTPPTLISVGTVFKNLRSDCFAGKAFETGWAEWSVYNKPDDLKDVDMWYEVNPSLGYHLRERALYSELDDGDELDFIIQRLGFWFSYDIKTLFSKAEWESLKYDHLDTLRACLKGKLFVGIKYLDETVSLSIAVRTKGGRIFVEAIDCRSIRDGNGWILAFLQSADVAKVIVDGKGRQQILADDMKIAKIKLTPVLPKVNDVIVANAAFEQAISERTITHACQPSLVQAVTNCRKRNIGSAGGFGFESTIEGVDMSLIESVSLAHWLCSTTKEKTKKRISY